MDRPSVAFLKAAARRPLGVATVFPTSSALARRLITPLTQSPPGRVIELGAGTGAITRHLVDAAPGQVTALEIDPELARFLRSHLGDIRVVCAPAEDMGHVVEPRTARAVVASLPWTMLSPLTQERIFAAVHKALVPGGVFATYLCLNAYLHPKARTFRARLHTWFPRVEEGAIEWRNLPPAVPWFAWSARN
ncbi:MAG: methyltransferase domain-containing protein [Pseudomonadota bacterium]|nr:methyltransferase domain-containing protein [Pseudomonadota bacterium]